MLYVGADPRVCPVLYNINLQGLILGGFFCHGSFLPIAKAVGCL